MERLFDRYFLIDPIAHSNNMIISEAKRGTKRFCGRIINHKKQSPEMTVLSNPDSIDLFFDSTSPVAPWYK